MIRFKCPHCVRGITAPDASAGKQARCPGCKAPLQVPSAARPAPQSRAADEADEAIAEVPRGRSTPGRPKPNPAAVRPRATARPKPPAEEEYGFEIVEDEEDVEVIEEAEEVEEVDELEEVEEEEEEEERPRRKRKKRRTGPWATCPHCGERGDARRVGWTLWGGWLGPWLLSHVRCGNCGGTYNGKTGKDNTTAIVLYVVVPLAIGIILAAIGAVFEFASR